MFSLFRVNVLSLLLLAIFVADSSTIVLAQPPSSISFLDRTKGSGVNFRYENGASGKKYLLEMVGAGAVSFDADRNGLIDLYLVNGGELPGRELKEKPTDLFYLNHGGFHFTEVTTQAGLVESAYGLAATSADYDNDGFADLYISNFGPNVLLHNNGDGTFTNVTSEAGVADGNKLGAGVTFVDINLDGSLDLFVGNYVDFSFERHDELAPKALPLSPEPVDYRAAKDTLFLSNGDGSFVDISERSGITQVAGNSMGVVAADFDGDGDSDIFVACDATPSLYYKNEGNETFIEEAYLVGVAIDQFGSINGSMGLDVGDVDGNGLLDIVVTNFAKQQVQQFQNELPGGFFTDVSSRTKIGKAVVPHVNWGVGLVDFDHDVDLDCYICNGHLFDDAKQFDSSTDYAVANCVMENIDRKSFRNSSAEAGSALSDVACSRTALFDDLDNDGDVDVFVINCDKPSQMLENSYTGNLGWLKIQLVGRTANRDAVGAIVKIETEAPNQKVTLFRINGRGYQSSYGDILHTGTGEAKVISKIEIRWPGNAVPTVLTDIQANHQIVCIEP